MERQDFQLAPMSGVFVALTGLIVGLAAVLLIAGAMMNEPALRWAAAGVAIACGAVWVVYRPTGFQITGSALRIVWPVRQTTVRREDIASLRIVRSPAEAKDILGTGFRIGVGGLFGTFGLIWSKKMGLMSVYVTRPNDLVLIERKGARPMLLTPADADGFADALGYGVGRDGDAATADDR